MRQLARPSLRTSPLLLCLALAGAVAATSGCGSSEAAAAPATPPASSDSTADRASTRVSEFYAAYLADPGPSVAVDYFDATMVSTLFSATDSDPVLCAQNLPSSVHVSPASVHPPTATVRVTPAWTGAEQSSITVTLRLTDLRVVGIACPA